MYRASKSKQEQVSRQAGKQANKQPSKHADIVFVQEICEKVI